MPSIMDSSSGSSRLKSGKIRPWYVESNSLITVGCGPKEYMSLILREERLPGLGWQELGLFCGDDPPYNLR